MVEHITLHDSENEFVGKKRNLAIPHVALTMDDFVVHYIDKSDYSNRYLSFVAKEDGTFKFSGNSINYSLDDGETWVELASDTDTPTVNKDDRIMWKGNLTPPPSSGIGDVDGIGIFSSSGKFDVEGNVMSLLNGDDFEGKVTLSDDYEFSMLFKGCINLENARRMTLPATTLTRACYRNMFDGCTSLTEAPELPATTLESYCYEYMFSGCTSLTTAPELKATTLTSSCYSSMFRGCTSLTTAPELKATTLVQHCYNNMFDGCTSLNKITCLATDISAIYCTQKWVDGVAANGTFVKNASMSSWTSGVDGIPSGWTVTNAA